jgi:hypothetical protein
VKHVRFSELAEMLKLTLRTFWNAEKRLFLYRDRDAHTQTDGYWLGERVGNGILELNYSFPSAARLFYGWKQKAIVLNALRSA